MTVLGVSVFGDSTLGISQSTGALGGVMTIQAQEPLWMTRHESLPHIEFVSFSPSPITMVREATPVPIRCQRLDGDRDA